MKLGLLPQHVVAATAAAWALALTACGDTEVPSEEVSAADPAATPGGVVTAIPDDFPLTAGWPRRSGEPGSAGLAGPNRTLSALDLMPCDVPADDPAYADRLRADWSDVEDFRSRQLTTYRTEADAAMALLALTETYRSCPGNHHDGGFTSHYVLERTSHGDESWSVARTETQPEGYPTAYLEVLHFVRVGKALLVDTDSGEGGAGPPGSLERQARRSAAEAEPVINAMCVFTVDGC